VALFADIPWGRDTQATYEILDVFPFSSDTKRMGIILRDEESGRVLFFMKGTFTQPC